MSAASGSGTLSSTRLPSSRCAGAGCWASEADAHSAATPVAAHTARAALGIARAAVDYVLLTHVHLDHAGGAGRLMQELPNAVAVLHPRGAPHMIDPSRLIEGSRAVYGERLEQLYGQLLPIPAARVRVVEDGERVRRGRRALELIHRPGHALPHYAVVDPAHASIFAGDTFGISYRSLDTAQGAFI